jgi:hypothetical protein
MPNYPRKGAYVLLDTASNPDDTTIIAAPEAGTAIIVFRVLIIVMTPVASTWIGVEDGVGGELIAGGNGALGGTYVTDYGDLGRRCTVAGLLNGTQGGATGAIAAVWVEYDEVS